MYFVMLYPCINFKAIWQLVIEILHLQTLRNTKSVITNAVVLVIGECHILVARYLRGYLPSYKFGLQCILNSQCYAPLKNLWQC